MIPWLATSPWLLPTLMLLGGSAETELGELYARACRVEEYRPPRESELARFAESVKAALGGEGQEVLPQEPAQGRGFFVFRGGGSSRLFLQAPHARGDDLDTDRIALRLAPSIEPRGLALSTVSRRQADLAREKVSYFQRATETFLAEVEGARILQLHGFSRTKRRTAEGRRAEIIVSSGHRTVLPPARELAACLREKLAVEVRLFPEVPELGATRNVQGRATPRGHFLHVELDRPLRRRLAEDDRALEAFAGCLPEGWR